jgi:hypothetical protein
VHIVFFVLSSYDKFNRSLKKFTPCIFIRTILVRNHRYQKNPFNRIQRMQCVGNQLLPITTNTPEVITKFYDHFTDYQYHMYYDFDNVVFPCKTLRGIHITSPKINLFDQNLPRGEYVTEIIASNITIDYDTLISCYPSIEKLEVHQITNFQYLPHIKYFHINGHVTNTKEILDNLPDTIESLIIVNGGDMTTIHDYQFPHLFYLKINLSCHTFSTSLNINTIIFLIHCDPDTNVEINVPNVKNIIITPREARYQKIKEGWLRNSEY